MLLFSTVKNHPLTFVKLSNCLEHKELVATWFTDEWGYIYDKSSASREEAIAIRKDKMPDRAERIWMVLLGSQPIGMFSLEPKEFDIRLMDRMPPTCEIYYVYVDKNFRSLGVGSQIVREIKRCAKEDMGTDLILLDTLKPKLKRMYEKEGAKVLCENQLELQPTEVLSITI